MKKKSSIGIFLVLLILIIGYIIISLEQNSDILKVKSELDSSKLNIFCFYVGEADSTLIMNKNQVMLIDAGNDSDGELIVQFLRNMNISKIDYLIATHSDDDHIGGMKDVINNFLNTISPQYVIISSGSTYKEFPNEKCLKRLLEKLDVENLYITERDGTIWITSDGFNEDVIQRLYKINLDGAESVINTDELNYEYLESIQTSMFSFFVEILHK